MGLRQHTALWALILIVNVLVLSPMLDCGYIGDDINNSYCRGLAARRGTSCLGLAVQDCADWVRHWGRFFPLAFSFYAVFGVLTRLLAYRLAGLALNLANVLLFARLVGRLTGSARRAQLAALLVPLTFQFRDFDPILGNCCLLPAVLGLLLGSLSLVDAHLESGRRRALAGAAVLYALAVLAYEVAWPFFVLPVVLTWLRHAGPRRGRAALRTALAFAVPAVLLAATPLALRAAYQVPLVPGASDAAEKYKVTLSLAVYARNLAKETAAALPLSYRALYLRDYRLLTLRGDALPAALLVLAVGHVAALLGVLRRADSRAGAPQVLAGWSVKPVGPVGLLGLGVLLTLLGGAVIATSPAHVDRLAWGVGYLPKYLAYYGVALVLTALLGALADGVLTERPRLRALAAAVLAAAGVLTYDANRAVVEKFDYDVCYPREVLEDGMRRGLFVSVPQGAAVFVNGPLPLGVLDGESFFRCYSGKRLAVRTAGDPGDGADGAERYYVCYDSRARDGGFAALAKIDGPATTPAQTAGAHAVRLYVRTPPHRPADFCVQGNWADGATGPGEAFTFEGCQLACLAEGNGWRLCDLLTGGRPVDLPSLRVRCGPAPPRRPY